MGQAGKRKLFFKTCILAAIACLVLLACVTGIKLNPHSPIPFFAFIANLVIGVFVYLKGKKRKLNRVFALWNIILGLDNLLLFGLFIAPSASFAKTWALITGPGYYLIPSTSLHFALVFTKSKSKLKKYVLTGTYCIAFLFFIFSFVPFFEKEYVKVGLTYAPKGNLLYTSSMIVLLVTCTGVLLQVLYAFFKSSSRHERSQYILFFIAGGIALALGGVNFLLSYGVMIYPVSSIAFVVYGLILAYAILRHRFLDIEIVVKKGLIYGGLTLSIAGGYAIVMVLANTVFKVASPTTSIPLNSAVIVLIAFFFQPLRERLQLFVDKKFFREKYNYRETLRRFSSDIIKIIGIEELSLRLVSVVTDTMKVENTQLMLRDAESGNYQTVAHKEYGRDAVYHPRELRKTLVDPMLLACVREKRNVLDKEELAYLMTASSESFADTQAADLLKSLEALKAHMAVPLVLKGEVTGLFTIGAKLSEEGFSAQDIELLQIILNQTAVAAENSELYDRTLTIKRYYDDIIKCMTSGMLTVDKSGNMVTLNPAGEKILGLSAEEIQGKNLNDFPEKNREFVCIILEMLEPEGRKGSAFRETELDYHNLNRKKLAVTTSLLTNERDETIGVVALFSDITEKKELESQLERSRRLAYMGEMAASIAHEIKNPIGSIRLFVDALARDFSNLTAQKNFKEVIPQEVENIDRMVRDLLFLARPPSLNKVHLDLAEIVKIVLQFCSEDAASKGAAFNTDAFDESVEVLADGEKLKQALRNIVLNAIEAVPPGKGEISISLTHDAVSAIINIADNGPGIAQEDLPRLFHPFYTTKHGGTGLGLAIANRIVEDHNGSIEVTSRSESGTKFSIVLPKEAPLS